MLIRSAPSSYRTNEPSPQLLLTNVDHFELAPGTHWDFGKCVVWVDIKDVWRGVGNRVLDVLVCSAPKTSEESESTKSGEE